MDWIIWLFPHSINTNPFLKKPESWDDSLLGDTLEDPGCSIQAAHAGGQGGDVETQQKQETNQGDLGKNKTQRGRECRVLHPALFRLAKRKEFLLC